MPFYNHLRADQDICLTICKCLQNRFMSAFFCRCIRIHPQDPRIRKPNFRKFFHLLRSGPKPGNIR